MAFISTGYNPQKPMEGRISDIGPRKYDSFFPPVIAKNFGKWLYHEILEPGVLVHVAASGDKVYTVRCGAARLMSTLHIREICEIADKYCGGHVRFTTRNNGEFMVTDEATLKALKEDLASRKFAAGSYKFPIGGTGAGVTISPIAFLIVKEGTVRILPIAEPATTSADRIIELVPDLVDRILALIQEKKKDENSEI